MFFRVSALLVPVLALSSLVVAEPESVAARGGEKGCNNGTQQCCKNSYQANQKNAQGLGIAAPIQGPLMASQCTTYTGGGIADGSNCNDQLLCCAKTALGGGDVSMGCMPVGVQI